MARFRTRGLMEPDDPRRIYARDIVSEQEPVEVVREGSQSAAGKAGLLPKVNSQWELSAPRVLGDEVSASGWLMFEGVDRKLDEESGKLNAGLSGWPPLRAECAAYDAYDEGDQE